MKKPVAYRRRPLLEVLQAMEPGADREDLLARILCGEVRVDGARIRDPRFPVGGEVGLVRRAFVSRGGLKLEGALAAHGPGVEGLCLLDAGCSTGGFTDCLLQRGAAKVYAIDVGKGILDWRLRNDPRVAVMEGRNVRYLEALPEPIDLLTADVSFISLRLLFPVFRGWMKAEAEAAVLIKPQFEAGRGKVGKGGVVRDPAVHRAVLEEVLHSAQGAGFATAGLIRSPLTGPAGNVEFLAHLRCGGKPAGEETLQSMINTAVG
jgi:23S rRNA (cytidine1920-2'-O)/16S rRNA (cytidine1409-2'-O)-methyltransferase